jgi:hypothetical protein
MKPLITICVPVYNQPGMLRKQFEAWAEYSAATRAAFRFIVVDDCSKDPVEVNPGGWPDVALYRIDKDVHWNRGMARNLATKMAETPYILHVDTDHVLPAESAAVLVESLQTMQPSDKGWFLFKRFRVGAADETRKKDKADPKAAFVEIHPHIDSYCCTPGAYWKAGGYNEDFSGVLGGGTPFLKEMVKAHGEPYVFSAPLHVHTRHSVPDSSEHTLSRDPKAFKARKHQIMAAHGTLRGHDPIRLPWHRIL